MSAARATVDFSAVRAARCSALLTTLSSVVIGTRWLTPERRSTRLSSRA